jgi:hypothetical protein
MRHDEVLARIGKIDMRDDEVIARIGKAGIRDDEVIVRMPRLKSGATRLVAG